MGSDPTHIKHMIFIGEVAGNQRIESSFLGVKVESTVLLAVLAHHHCHHYLESLTKGTRPDMSSVASAGVPPCVSGLDVQISHLYN